MNDLQKVSMIEFSEGFLQVTAVSMLLVAMAFGPSSVSFSVSEELANSLNMLETGLGMLVLVILLPMFLYKFGKLTRSQRRQGR